METLRCHLVDIEVDLVGLFADSCYFASDQIYNMRSRSFTVERDSDHFQLLLLYLGVDVMSLPQSCQFRDNQDDILIRGAVDFSQIGVIEPRAHFRIL